MNIILSDRLDTLTELVLKKKTWNISVLIVQNDEKKKKYSGNNRIASIYTLNELQESNDFSDFSIDLVRKVKHVQLLSDYGLRRILDDCQFSKYSFFSSLAMINRFFHCGNIDACIINEPVHGFASDALLAEIAKINKVPVYNFMVQTYGKFCINMDVIKGDLIKLSNRSEFSRDDIYKAAHYIDLVEKNNDDKKIWKKKVIELCGMIFFRTVRCTLRRNKYININFRDYSIFDYYKSWFNIWRMRSYIKRKYGAFEKNVPYVVYFLHLEPEAIVTNYAETMDSQLVIISMLAQTLPEGWRLYVKEHPDTYKLNTEKFDYFVPNYTTYQTRFFFDKIASLPNTCLIDYRIPASEIIKNAKAVASICGTVLLEAITECKPILEFANNNKYIISFLNDVFTIQSYDDLKKALTMISKGFVPRYCDLNDTYNDYLLPMTSEGYLKGLEEVEKRLVNG